MGILETRWEADYEGHKVTVFRNEVTKGFNLEWDGSEIARRSWSWIGLGKLEGTAEHNGEPVEVQVAIEWGGLRQLDGTCTLSVGGKEIVATRIR
ncbi:MAG: hypothetical protein L6Q84_16415 [Polyangiaceae bacterium]|nr:hypothetical protein [Polyangiaceae bacterium]